MELVVENGYQPGNLNHNYVVNYIIMVLNHTHKLDDRTYSRLFSYTRELYNHNAINVVRKN